MHITAYILHVFHIDDYAYTCIYLHILCCIVLHIRAHMMQSFRCIFWQGIFMHISWCIFFAYFVDFRAYFVHIFDWICWHIMELHTHTYTYIYMHIYMHIFAYEHMFCIFQTFRIFSIHWRFLGPFSTPVLCSQDFVKVSGPCYGSRFWEILPLSSHFSWHTSVTAAASIFAGVSFLQEPPRALASTGNHLFWNLTPPAHSISLGKARTDNAALNAQILFTSCAFAQCETALGV